MGSNTFHRSRGLFQSGSLRKDEGCWIKQPIRFESVGVFGARDLVYLDADYIVLQVIEGYPPFRLAPACNGASSLLALPTRSICSSQTAPGSRLVICAAEEMEFHLRSLPSPLEGGYDTIAAEVKFTSKHWLPENSARDRRGATRKRWPRLVAFDSQGDSVAVHGIRDISATGLYLLTSERWPLGAQVRMSLQRTDGIGDDAMSPITVDLRVCRWGVDGVGFEFVPSEVEQPSMLALEAQQQ